MTSLVRFIPILLLVAAACGQSTPAPSGAPVSKVGGAVTFVATTDPDTLDLHQTSNPVSSTIFGWIYEPLIYQDLDNSYKGLLAEGWTVSPDNRTITFKLRKGVTFTDGSPLNAEAVKFTFERLQRVGAKSPIFETFKNVTSMEAKDELTFVMNMKEPYAPIFHDLQVSYAGILSPSAVKGASDNIGRAAVGTGPYKLKEFQTGQQITLTRNADYKWPPALFQNRGAPYIEELRYRVISEPATQLAALDAGEVDALGLRAQDIAKYGSDSRFKVFDSFTFGLTYLGFDAKRPPFDNAKLRAALAKAVNKDEIVQVVFDNKLAKAQCCPIAESIQGYDPKLKEFEQKYEPAKAKAELDGLGYKPGTDGLRATPDGKPFKPVLYTSTSDTHGKIATLLQAQFKAVGVDLQIKQLESGALLAATPKAEHDLYLNGYSWNEPDMFSLFLSCDRVTSSNRVLYCNPQLEDLIKKGRTELDQAKRMQIYFEAQKLTLQEAPWQPLYMSVSKTAVSVKIQDLRQGQAGGLYWHDAWVKQ
ncbi:MAG TPA: ABC transporter substrate-binding protein [Candidatus Limnocylindria bacterium]|nr:ABC transporter substrate-binding protein [Candidatus Limnocylindria bacterium]